MGSDARSRLVFLALAAFVLSPWASPSLALVLGIAFALSFEHPWARPARTAAKPLLQAGVVGLGFGMNLNRVAQAGAAGLLYTAGGIVFSMGLGLLLARLLRVRQTTAYLISTGTAICGGSAIAAVGPVLGADEEEMSVSLGTVFVLNAAALLIFPAIGRALGLTQEQFGLWAALAIHDTSSVVGATVKYGAVALAVGTTVKLARALWIVPMSLGTALWRRSRAQVQWPWFILLFTLAAAVNTFRPHPAWGALNAAGKTALTATLFLIGSGISAGALRKVGARPLLLGLILWVLAAGVSLGLIVAGVIS